MSEDPNIKGKKDKEMDTYVGCTGSLQKRIASFHLGL